MGNPRSFGPTVLAIALVGLLFTAGCGGPKGITPESALDTPEGAYDQGMRYLDAGELDSALAQFQRSIDLARGADRKFAPGYEGLGLVHLARGDYDLSRKMFETSMDEDHNYAPAHVGMGRLHDAQEEYDDALGEFEKASRLDPDATDPYLWSGETYIHMELYDDAEGAFKKVMGMDPTHQQANLRWEELQRARRAIAGGPPEYVAIAHSPAITRADLAALLVMEIDLEKIFREAPETETTQFRPPSSWRDQPEQEPAETGRTPNDIAGHWARSYVEQALDAGLMEIYPDGSFHPNETITRTNYALLVEHVLSEALRDEGLATRYIGGRSPFSDVPSSHYAFNAIMVSTTRGIMKARLDGTFGPLDPVPGTDALLMIRVLKDQLP